MPCRLPEDELDDELEEDELDDLEPDDEELEDEALDDLEPDDDELDDELEDIEPEEDELDELEPDEEELEDDELEDDELEDLAPDEELDDDEEELELEAGSVVPELQAARLQVKTAGRISCNQRCGGLNDIVVPLEIHGVSPIRPMRRSCFGPLNLPTRCFCMWQCEENKDGSS